MADRLLLKGGHVLTMDADLGDLTGDVLIEDGRIAAVVIDGSAVNVAPVIDPVAAQRVTGGTVHKRDGRLTADLSGPRALIEAPKEHLIDALAQRQAESA